ncbi:MAG: hypothetical protein K0U47_00430 [Epsilonproteobacteria bacterium]|nr:hypothetical protein [Campylobacterota bacterium]
MVRFIVLLALVVSLGYANSLHTELKNILGQNSYHAKKKFLQIIFKEEQKFYTQSEVDIHKVLVALKEHNLLRLDFKKTKDLQLSFATEQNNPLLFMKMLQNSLNVLGYSTPSTQKVMRDSSGFLWKVRFKSSSAIDPVLFAKELKKQHCYITQIKRYSKSNWRFNIDIRNIDIVPQTIALNKKTKLKKPHNPYWIDVERARTIVLNSPKANSWYPYIVFYDRDLNILDNITKERKSYNEQFSVPRNAKYVKISDIYTLENLKRGLSIYISK